MKNNIFILAIILIATASNGQQCLKHGIPLESMPACNDGDYYLVFEDNFDGNSLDLSKWHIPYQGVGRDFSHVLEKEWFANTGVTPNIPYSNNIEVSNGTLKIIAKKETVIGTYVTDWTITPPDKSN